MKRSNGNMSDDTVRVASRNALKIAGGFFLGSIAYVAISSLVLTKVFDDPGQIASWEITKEAIYVTVAAAALYYAVRGGLVAVAEAREQLHHLINNMPDAFLSLDAARRFTFVNKKAAEIYGRTQEQMIGRPLADHTSIENERIMRQFLDTAVAAQKVWREQMHAPVTGVWYELTAYPRGQEVSIFLHSVTEQRAAGERMRRLSLAIDNMTDALYVLDRNDRFLIVNKSVADYYGKSADALVGESVWPYFASQNVPILRRMIEAARATGSVQREQMSRDDRWFQVMIYPSGDELLISFHDITQARESERRLAQKVREQSTLAKFSVTALQAEESPRVKQEAAELVRETLEADYALVAHVSANRADVTIMGAAGLPESAPRAFKTAQLAPTSLAAGLLRERKPLHLPAPGPDAPTTVSLLPDSLGVRCAAGAVAQCADGSSMLLISAARNRREFTDGDAEFLQTMVNMVAALRDRRHAHDTLRLRDRALEAITQGITMAEVRGDASFTIYTNPAFVKITGYSPQELLHKGMDLLFPKGVPAVLAEEATKAYRENRPLSVEVEITRKDGSTLLDRMISAPLADASGKVTHFVSVHEDITEERRAEILLKRKTDVQTALAAFTLEAFASERFSELVKSVSALARNILNGDYASVVDVNPGDDTVRVLGTDGWETEIGKVHRFSDWAKDGLVPYCLKADEPVRFTDIRNDRRFKSDEASDALGVTSGVVVSVKSRENIHGLLFVLSREKRAFSDDDVQFLQTIANVVAMLKERERALGGLHMRERALDSISQGITITDETLPDPTIIYTNPAFARMSGYSVGELTGMPSRSFMPPNPPPGLAERLALARAKRREVRFDSPAKRKNGTTFLDHVTASPIVNADGDLTNYVSIHEDITEARQRDERLHESQKMEAVGQLTGGIAHDFNNLLTVVRANAEDMREELKDSPLLFRQADMVLQAATRGADLVQQLMAFARKQELEPKVIDINVMLDTFTKLVRRTLQENVRIEVLKGKNLPAVKVDPGRLENAILNLSINARDAMPDGGTITVETQVVTLDSGYAAENPGVVPGKYVQIAVSDTGTGMTKDVMEKAFQPFFTTKEVGQGTGLGLSMVYGFVKQSGGHAKIYSEVGHGTTVKIFLPPTAEAMIAAILKEDRAEQTGGSGKILLVEDDDLVRESVEGKLLRLGYTVTPVSSAAEALQMLEHNPHFDMVFTDVIMPGAMTGADLARDVMRRWPGIKILMTSGYTEASALGKVKMPEGVRLLSKPYSNADLAKAFRDVLDPVAVA